MALPLGIPFLCCRRESNPPLCFGAPPQRTGLLYWPPLCRRATLFPAAWNIFDKLLPLSCGSLWLCLSASPSCAAGGSRTRLSASVHLRSVPAYCTGRPCAAGLLSSRRRGIYLTNYCRSLAAHCGSASRHPLILATSSSGGLSLFIMVSSIPNLLRSPFFRIFGRVSIWNTLQR